MNAAHTNREALSRSHSYEGEAHGVRFTCHACNRPRGKMRLTLHQTKDHSFKRAAERLIDALNGQWARSSGYTLAPSRALLWRDLFVAGWDAGMDWRGCYGEKTPPLLEAPDGRQMTLKEAAEEIAREKAGADAASSVLCTSVS